MKWHAVWLCCLPVLAAASVTARDADGTVTLSAPARRVVTLAPHATELLYAAGAGDTLVGTVDYSDYPPAARRVPRIGSYTGVGIEALLRLHPDLVVVWKDSVSVRDLARLQSSGIAVFLSRPTDLDDVAREVEALGTLTGHGKDARPAADAYRTRLARLRARYRDRAPVSVFYQVASDPLFTVSDKSFIGAMLALCGGRNVFGSARVPAPQISREAVLRARPQVMLSGRLQDLARWDAYPDQPAVAHRTRYAVPEDLTSRPGPRLVEGAEAVCQRLDAARGQLGLTGR